MAGVSIEGTLEFWVSSLQVVKARMRPLFLQERMATSAGLFLDGRLEVSGARPASPGGGGDPGTWRQQAILGRAQWDADALRLCAGDAGRAGDRRDRVLKQSKASCGVGRQYTGSAGKITNCQVGVFAAYASRHGHAFVDHALYLPKA